MTSQLLQKMKMKMKAITVYERRRNVIIRIIKIKMVSLKIVLISHFSRHDIELQDIWKKTLITIYNVINRLK